MATKSNPWAIFIGACGAFLIQSIVAVSFGGVFSYFPEKWIHLIAGILFFVFAAVALRRKEDDESRDNSFMETNPAFTSRAMWSSFMVIFIAEWGDLTQLATASLVARYGKPITILISATLALWAVTALAVVVGNRAKKIFRPVLLNRIAAVVFVAVGVYLISSWFSPQ